MPRAIFASIAVACADGEWREVQTLTVENGEPIMATIDGIQVVLSDETQVRIKFNTPLVRMEAYDAPMGTARVSCWRLRDQLTPVFTDLTCFWGRGGTPLSDLFRPWMEPRRLPRFQCTDQAHALELAHMRKAHFSSGGYVGRVAISRNGDVTLRAKRSANYSTSDEELNKFLSEENEEDANDIKSRSIEERAQARAECVRAAFVLEDNNDVQRATFENSAQAQTWVRNVVEEVIIWETNLGFAFTWVRSRVSICANERAGTWTPLN